MSQLDYQMLGWGPMTVEEDKSVYRLYACAHAQSLQ